MSPPPTLSLDAYKCCWRRGRFLRTLTLSEGQITTMDPVWGQVTRRMLVSDLVDYALTERAGSFDISLSFRTLGWCGGTVATLQVSSTHWLEVHRHPIRRPSHLAHSAISRIALRQTLKRGGRRYQTLSAAPTSPFSRFSTEPHSLPAAFPSLTCSPRHVQAPTASHCSLAEAVTPAVEERSRAIPAGVTMTPSWFNQTPLPVTAPAAEEAGGDEDVPTPLPPPPPVDVASPGVQRLPVTTPVVMDAVAKLMEERPQATSAWRGAGRKARGSGELTLLLPSQDQPRPTARQTHLLLQEQARGRWTLHLVAVPVTLAPVYVRGSSPGTRASRP